MTYSATTRTATIFAMAFAMSVARIGLASDPTPRVFPPLQIFKEICVDAGWSLNDVVQLAEQRRFARVSQEDVPLPDGNSAHKILWQAETEVGPVVIVVIAGENKAHIYRLTCSVTAPSQYSGLMQAWVSNSAGKPTATLTKPNNATAIHWANTFDEGKIEFTLNTEAPDDKHVMLSIAKQIAMTGAKSK
jgi:hypothetical protein